MMAVKYERIEYDEPTESYFKVNGPYDTYDHERHWILEGFSVEHRGMEPPEKFTVPGSGVTYIRTDGDAFCHTTKKAKDLHGHTIYECTCEKTGYGYRTTRNQRIGVCPYCNRPTYMEDE